MQLTGKLLKLYWKLTLVYYLDRLECCVALRDMDQGTAKNLTSMPRVHFVAFIAYYVPFVAPAIYLAVNHARKQTSDINYTYSALANPDDPSCDRLIETMSSYLADFFYGFAKNPYVYIIVLATGNRILCKIVFYPHIWSLVIAAMNHETITRFWRK